MIEDIIKEFCDLYKKDIKPEFMKLMPSVNSFIKTLFKRGFELYLLTGDFKCVALKRLSLFGMEKYFKGGIFGNQDYYKFNLIEIARQKIGVGIYFDDRPENIKKAKELGFTVVGIEVKNTAEELRKAGADMILKD